MKKKEKKEKKWARMKEVISKFVAEGHDASGNIVSVRYNKRGGGKK